MANCPPPPPRRSFRPALLAAIWTVAVSVAGAGPLYGPLYVTTTVAGSGAAGHADGIGCAAVFNHPFGVAVDSSGNIYVADNGSHVIRKIVPQKTGLAVSTSSGITYTGGGIVTTLAGSPGKAGSADGTGSDARFNGPTYLAVDKAGNIFVSDTGNDTIRMVTPAGVVTTVAGKPGAANSDDGTGGAARFDGPTGIAVNNAGVIYVADGNNNTVRKITPGQGGPVRVGASVYASLGVVTTVVGLPGFPGSADGSGLNSRFNAPAGLAVYDKNHLYVADSANFTIRSIGPGADDATMTVRTSVYLPPENVVTFAGTRGHGGYEDTPGPTPGMTQQVAAPMLFSTLAGLALDKHEVPYVVDSGNGAIRRVFGNAITVAGSPTSQPGFADGLAGAARFNRPQGIAINEAGTIYVADTFNNLIRSCVPAGRPTITSAPPPVTVPVGGTVTLSVGADYIVPLSYKWSFNHQVIPGAISSSYTITNAQPANEGNYSVEVIGVQGYSVNCSARVTVNLNPTPNPAASGGANNGSGGALSYWFYAALALALTVRQLLRKRGSFSR